MDYSSVSCFETRNRNDWWRTVSYWPWRSIWARISSSIRYRLLYQITRGRPTTQWNSIQVNPVLCILSMIGMKSSSVTCIGIYSSNKISLEPISWGPEQFIKALHALNTKLTHINLTYAQLLLPPENQSRLQDVLDTYSNMSSISIPDRDVDMSSVSQPWGVEYDNIEWHNQQEQHCISSLPIRSSTRASTLIYNRIRHFIIDSSVFPATATTLLEYSYWLNPTYLWSAW